MRFSRSLSAVIFSALSLALAGGCTTASRTRAPGPATPAVMPAHPAESAPGAAAAPAPTPTSAAPAATPAVGVPPAGGAAAGTLDLLVESAPPGAIIVLDGVPVGRAPLRLPMAATPLGFFQDYREILARFVATDEEQVTRSSVEEFTPREKVPAVLRFTPDGAERTMR